MPTLFFAVATIAVSTVSAFAVTCTNYCNGRCAHSDGTGHDFCVSQCMPRCEAPSSKKKH